jgi:signal transduction histidine kinase
MFPRRYHIDPLGETNMSKEIVTDLSSDEKLQKILTLTSSITHEMRNYIAAIKIGMRLSKTSIEKTEKVIEIADYFMTSTQSRIKKVFTDQPVTSDFQRCSIAKDVQEVLEQYPFMAYEKSLVRVKEGDFEYMGDPVLTNQVLYNLIKNSMRAIKNAGEGIITIKFRAGEECNELVFRDTATGIPKEFMPKLFKLFESQMTKEGGTGIGLAFCKLTMQSYGGDITCDSVEGEYTEFVLKFPVIK